MIQAIQRFRDERDDRGFTLIELMVVVLIIAILIAIAIPTFLGARTKAQDRAAQSDLRTGLVTAQAFYTDNESYLDTNAATTATAYQVDEPSIDFDAAANTTGTTVGVYEPLASSVVLVKKSKSGQWVCLTGNSAAPSVKFITTDKPATNPYTTLATCAAGATSVAW